MFFFFRFFSQLGADASVLLAFFRLDDWLGLVHLRRVQSGALGVSNAFCCVSGWLPLTIDGVRWCTDTGNVQFVFYSLLDGSRVFLIHTLQLKSCSRVGTDLDI